MSLALSTMRTALCQLYGQYESGTTTANGLANGMSVIDGNLGYFDDDTFNSHWLLITSLLQAGKERYIDDFATGSGTFTPITAYPGQILSGTTYEILPWPSANITDALNYAAQTVYPDLYKAVVDDSIVLGNWLKNASFETYSTTFTNWTLTGAGGTATQDTATVPVKHGTYTAKITRAGTDVVLTQGISEVVALEAAKGRGITFYCWVFATVASSACLAIYDGTTRTKSDYHQGQSRWELLYVNASIAESASDFRVELRIETTNTSAYFDDARVRGFPELYSYDLPSDFTREPSAIYYEGRTASRSTDYSNPYIYLPGNWWHLETDGTTKKLRLLGWPTTEDHRLRLVGEEVLSTVSADANTMEVSTEQAQAILYPAAIVYLLQRSVGKDDKTYATELGFWLARLNDGKKAHRMPAKGVSLH